MSQVVTFGEIMLRLSPPGFLRFSQTNAFDLVYGGGESNVAVSLANYGVASSFVSRLPNNDIGDCALMEMRKEVLTPTTLFVAEIDWVFTFLRLVQFLEEVR